MEKTLLTGLLGALLLAQGCAVLDVARNNDTISNATQTLREARSAIKDGDGYCAKDERARILVRNRVNSIFLKGKWKTSFRIDCLAGHPSLVVNVMIPL